jgi:hypothetical protein
MGSMPNDATPSTQAGNPIRALAQAALARAHATAQERLWETREKRLPAYIHSQLRKRP